MKELLEPYAAKFLLTPKLLVSLQSYLDLLLKWNARTSLTAIRDPEELVWRQMARVCLPCNLLKHLRPCWISDQARAFRAYPFRLRGQSYR